MPKIHSVDDLERVSRSILIHRPSDFSPLQLVSSVESALAILNSNSIAAWKSAFGPAGGVLTALLVSSATVLMLFSLIIIGSLRPKIVSNNQSRVYVLPTG